MTTCLNTGRFLAVSQFGLKTKVAVFRCFCLFIDEANVVRASRNTVLAADTAIRVHRNDSGLAVHMCGTGRTDACAGRILTLLTGNTNVNAFAVASFQFSALRTRRAGYVRTLPLQQQARAPFRQVVGFIASCLAQTAAYALVLIKDHRIVRSGGCSAAAGLSARGAGLRSLRRTFIFRLAAA